MNYDVLVIGGGPGGCKAAELAGKAGLKVALFEKDKLGGVCLNYGCIPTKSLLHGVKMFNQMKNEAPIFGVTATDIKLNPEILWKRTERTINRMRTALKCRLEDSNVEIIYGEASWGREKNGTFCIKTIGQKFYGKHLIIATGGKPVIPKIKGINNKIACSPCDFMKKFNIPKSLVIIGGGVSGIEFATIYAGLGSKITVIEKSINIGGGVDEKIAVFLLDAYRKKGINFCLNTTANSIVANGVILANGEFLEADKVLIACGFERGEPEEKDLSNIHIIGDAKGPVFLASIAENDAEIAINKILGNVVEKLDNFQIPHIIFSDPEVACCGLTLGQAKKIDRNAIAKIVHLNVSARYSIENPYDNGFGIFIYSHTQELLGIQLLGNGGIELLASKIKAKIHPSLAELIN